MNVARFLFSSRTIKSKSTEGVLTSNLFLPETRIDRPNMPFSTEECQERSSYSRSLSPASTQEGDRASSILENKDNGEGKDSKVTDYCSDTDSDNLKGVSAS